MSAQQKIAFVDLKAQYQALKPEMDAAIQKVVTEMAFIGGPHVKAFEGAFAAYCGAAAGQAIGCSNGTDALRLALLACGVGAGDEVIVPAHTFIATAEAVSMIGATVRFVDVRPDTYCIDPAAVEKAITPRTKAVLPVHLYGRPADMDALLAIGQRHKLRVIGDAAQAHGAVYKGKKIATLGDAVCFSFYPGKNLGAYGDAGAVVSTDSEIATKVALLRDHGRTKKYEHDIVGLNCRMDGIQGAVLSVKLPHLETWTRRRIENARLYDQLLAGVPGVTHPVDPPEVTSVYHLYVIQTAKDREKVQAALKERGIETGVHYPIPLHLQPAYAHLGYKKGDFPVTEQQCANVLSLPMFPELTESQIRYVVESITSVLQAP